MVKLEQIDLKLMNHLMRYEKDLIDPLLISEIYELTWGKLIEENDFMELYYHFWSNYDSII